MSLSLSSSFIKTTHYSILLRTLPKSNFHNWGRLKENKFDLRSLGVARNAWVGSYGNEQFFVPFEYKGNAPALENVFNGKELSH